MGYDPALKLVNKFTYKQTRFNKCIEMESKTLHQEVIRVS